MNLTVVRIHLVGLRNLPYYADMWAMKLAEPHKRACIYKHINRKLVISVYHIPLRSQIMSTTEVFALLGRYAAVIGS
jgi:hypothetical protein